MLFGISLTHKLTSFRHPPPCNCLFLFHKIGDNAPHPTPTLITFGVLSTLQIKAVSGADSVSIALVMQGKHAFGLTLEQDTRGRMVSFGNGFYSDTFLPPNSYQPPTFVAQLSTVSFARVVTGSSVGFAISEPEGKLYASGLNSFGRLGFGDTVNQLVIHSSLSTLAVLETNTDSSWRVLE